MVSASRDGSLLEQLEEGTRTSPALRKRTDAPAAIIDYIAFFYKGPRHHSLLGYQPPPDHESSLSYLTIKTPNAFPFYPGKHASKLVPPSGLEPEQAV